MRLLTKIVNYVRSLSSTFLGTILLCIAAITFTVYLMNRHSHIEINLADQHLHLYNEYGQLCFECPISSGIGGIGSEENSAKTPTGNFIIAERFGDGLPDFTIFKARRAVGNYPNAIPSDMNEDSDYILTRILWLDGTDSHNANTKNRYIYIHGTNREDLLGSAVSHGCIRVSPENMITLFNSTDLNTTVLIFEKK